MVYSPFLQALLGAGDDAVLHLLGQLDKIFAVEKHGMPSAQRAELGRLNLQIIRCLSMYLHSNGKGLRSSCACAMVVISNYKKRTRNSRVSFLSQ
tara:strand:+ start:420 stop:704 length:285 start_codon:yes stop_codon:yes gene_type:complete